MRSETNLQNGVLQNVSLRIASELEMQKSIDFFLARHRSKFLKRNRNHGVNPDRVFDLCCYVYRRSGFTVDDMALIFQKHRSLVHKASERFKYRLIEWRKQGIEPPSLES
jgi:hypothetical protein